MPTFKERLWTLPAGDMKFALGVDYRNISYNYLPDAEIQSGDPFTYNTQTPTKGASPVQRSVRRIADPGDEGYSLLRERECGPRGPLFRLCLCRAAAPHTKAISTGR